MRLCLASEDYGAIVSRGSFLQGLLVYQRQVAAAFRRRFHGEFMNPRGRFDGVRLSLVGSPGIGLDLLHIVLL